MKLRNPILLIGLAVIALAALIAGLAPEAGLAAWQAVQAPALHDALVLAAAPTILSRSIALGYEAKGEDDDAAPGLAEIKTMLQKQGSDWEEFKKTNNERLAKLEKGEPVADLDAKLAKLNEELTKHGNALKSIVGPTSRPSAGGGAASDAAQLELKNFNSKAAAFAAEKSRSFQPLTAEQYSEFKAGISGYIRRGAQELGEAERKAINVGTDPQGGYLLGEDMEATIDRVLRRYSAIRSLARVIPIGNASYKKLVKVTGTSGAVRGGETTAPTQGTSQTWSEIEFRPGTYISDQRITSEALEDAVQDVEADLLEEMGIEFAEMEGQDFIDGNGVNGPRGLLSYPMVQNASYVWGSVGHIVSGGAAGFAASNPSDALMDLQHALRRQYRANASWSMNDATLGAIRKFKDGNGLYLWAPSALMQGAVGQLLGHPVVTDDFMPDLGAGAYPIAFADFQRAYYVVDRKGTMVLRDPYTAVPYVKFVGRRRVGGGIANFEAVKLLRCSN